MSPNQKFMRPTTAFIVILGKKNGESQAKVVSSGLI